MHKDTALWIGYICGEGEVSYWVKVDNIKKD